MDSQTKGVHCVMSEVNLGKVNTNFLRKRDSTKNVCRIWCQLCNIYICEMINVCKNMHSFWQVFLFIRGYLLYSALLVSDKSYSLICRWYSGVSLHRRPVSDLLFSFSPVLPGYCHPASSMALAAVSVLFSPLRLKTGPTACPDLSLQVSGLWNDLPWWTLCLVVPASFSPARSLHTHSAVPPWLTLCIPRNGALPQTQIWGWTITHCLSLVNSSPDCGGDWSSAWTHAVVESWLREAIAQNPVCCP